MTNLSLSQLIVLILFLILLFGDISKIKNIFKLFTKNFDLRKISIKKKNRKKGS